MIGRNAPHEAGADGRRSKELLESDLGSGSKHVSFEVDLELD